MHSEPLFDLRCDGRTMDVSVCVLLKTRTKCFELVITSKQTRVLVPLEWSSGERQAQRITPELSISRFAEFRDKLLAKDESNLRLWYAGLFDPFKPCG